MRDHEEALGAAGIALAAVGLADRGHALAFRRDTGIGFPLLVDEERRAYRAAQLRSGSPFELVSRANRKAMARAKAAGHAQHSLGKHPFQLGGSFVFGPGDVDLEARPSATFGDIAPVEEMVAIARRAMGC